MANREKPGNSGEYGYPLVNPFLHHRAVLAAQRKCEVGVPVMIDIPPVRSEVSEEVRLHSFVYKAPSDVISQHRPDGYIAHGFWDRPIIVSEDDFDDGYDVPIVIFSASPSSTKPGRHCLAKVTEAANTSAAVVEQHEYAFWNDGTVTMLTSRIRPWDKSDFPIIPLDDQQVVLVANAIEGAMITPAAPVDPGSPQPPGPAS